MRAILRILHISDLHDRGSAEKDPARRYRVLGPAWDRNLDDILTDGPIDLVCFTGDLAQSGKADEYLHIHGFLSGLLKRLKLPLERLFVIPGNHDVDRGPPGSPQHQAWQELRVLAAKVQPIELARWLRGDRAPLGLRDELREHVLGRMDAYHDFLVGTLGRGELLPRRSPHGRLGYRIQLRWSGPPVYIIGLYSGWLAGDEHDTGKLLLTDEQIHRLATDDEGKPLKGFRLALIHHPLSDLADRSMAQKQLAEHVDLLLRGHLHEPEPESWADPQRTLRMLAAGCLYEGGDADLYPNACHVVQVTLDSEGRPLRHQLRFRGWSKNGHWFNDNSLYRDATNGRLEW